MFLEREVENELLLSLLSEAAQGQGHMVVISGEAGIGKTALVKEFLTDLQQPTIVVIEDLHWADDATLDFLRFLARRIEDRPILLILTARDDSLDGRQRIRSVVGALPTDAMTRMVLVPLTHEAVTILSQTASMDSKAVYELAGENAFYVTELLKSGNESLPLNVQDSVLIRAEALSP